MVLANGRREGRILPQSELFQDWTRLLDGSSGGMGNGVVRHNMILKGLGSE